MRRYPERYTRRVRLTFWREPLLPSLLCSARLQYRLSILQNTSGFFWAILYENGLAASNDRLWFARGNDLAVYNLPLGSTQAQPFAALTPEQNLGLANLNSVAPFWEAVPVRRAYRSAPRSLASHSRMAKQAREAALAYRVGRETKE